MVGETGTVEIVVSTAEEDVGVDEVAVEEGESDACGAATAQATSPKMAMRLKKCMMKMVGKDLYRNYQCLSTMDILNPKVNERENQPLGNERIEMKLALEQKQKQRTDKIERRSFNSTGERHLAS